MVSSACVELPRGPFGLVFSLRNVKNITRQVGVSLGVNNQDLLCVDTSMLFAISSPWGPFFLAALTRQLKDKIQEMHFISQIFFWRDGADNMMGRRHRDFSVTRVGTKYLAKLLCI